MVDFDCSAGYFLITFFLQNFEVVLSRRKISEISFVNSDYLTHFTSFTKFLAYTGNFRPKVTFQKRVKYRKMVFDPKPEVFPVRLGDPDESL